MTKSREEFVTENIPMDCWELIFNRLNHDDLKLISLVCKNFLKISNNLVKSIQVIHPDINLFHQRLRRFRKIKRIDFKNFEGRIEASIRAVVSSGISVEALELCIERKSQINVLMKLASKNLKVLKCFHPDGVNYDLSMIATCFPNLEELHVRNSDRCDWDSPSPSPSPTALPVECLASYKLKLLKKVVFHNFDDITDESLDVLSLNCALLEDVALCSNIQLTRTGIGCLLRNRPNMKALFIECVIDASANPAITIENSIGYARALASLSFNSMDVSDDVLKAIAKAKLPLKKFELYNCTKYSVSGLAKVLHSSKDLRELFLPFNNFDDSDMKLLLIDGVGKNITHMDIQNSYGTTRRTLSRLLTKCPSLVSLSMDLEFNHRWDTEAVSKKYHNIQKLNLCLRSLFLDAFVVQMGHFFPNLQVLELQDCADVTSICIEALFKSCSSITTLKLILYNEAMVVEADDSELPILNLKVLELTMSDLDDEGLAAIAKRCQRLVSLNLACCNNVTTEGMKHIVKNIKTLTSLHLDNLRGLSYGKFLEWMLSSNNMASLKRIFIPGYKLHDKRRNRFLHHGCSLFSD